MRQIGDTGVGIGRRTGWIELDGLDEAAVQRTADFIGGSLVGQIKGHQRFEA